MTTRLFQHFLPMRLNMKFLIQIAFLLTVVTNANAASLFTSIHLGSSDSGRVFFVANSEKSIAQAKRNSLQMCTNKFTAKNCEELFAEKGEGYLAVIDSPDGFYGWSFNSERQVAIDNAFAQCKKIAAVCKSKASVVEASLSKSTIARIEASKYPPVPAAKPGVTTCTSRCMNGNCFVSYSNGNRKQVQLQRQFNAIKNEWFFPPLQC